MRVLILGSEGFIGKNLVKEFYGNDIIGIDIVGNSNEGNLHKFITCDLSLDGETLKQTIKDFLPDVIINSAATVGVDNVKKHSIEAARNNFGITYNLCRSLLDIKQEGFNPLVVFFSSSEIYGNTSNASTSSNTYEIFPMCERSLYTSSKLLEESMYNSLRKEYSNVKILRLFNITGIGQKKDFVLPKFIHSVIHEDSVTASLSYRCFCDVGFLTDCILKLSKHKYKNLFPDVTNFTSFRKENYVSMVELANICASVAGKSVPISVKSVLPEDIVMRKSEIPSIPNMFLDRKKDISIFEIVSRIYEAQKW